MSGLRPISDLFIAGFCPMGCGEVLIRGDGGHVTCTFIDCPDPSAVDTILTDREYEHVVRFTDTGFSLRHPLRERLNGELWNCDLHLYIEGLSGPPVQAGDYRARWRPREGGWTWEPLP